MIPKMIFPFCQRRLEYDDCISAVDQTLPKRDVLGMTLTCIQWWCFNSVAFDSMEYAFIGITPRTTRNQSYSAC